LDTEAEPNVTVWNTDSLRLTVPSDEGV
jgi:hypothetical protein